jgi:hypothetical protein
MPVADAIRDLILMDSRGDAKNWVTAAALGFTPRVPQKR